MTGPACSTGLPVNKAGGVLLCSGRQASWMKGLLQQKDMRYLVCHWNLWTGLAWLPDGASCAALAALLPDV